MKIKSLLAILTICIGTTIQAQAQAQTSSGKKILIAYFSWNNSGNTHNTAMPRLKQKIEF